MRFLIKVSMSTDRANALAKSGKIGATTQAILADLKPEAAYFTVEGGRRTAYLIADIAEPSQFPRVAEPWFQAFDASIEVFPVMTAEELGKAGPDIAQAAAKYT